MIEFLVNYLDDDIYNLSNYLIISYKKYLRYLILKGSNLFIYTLPQNIQYLLKTFKNSILIKSHILIDLFGTDYPGQKNRFKIIYSLSSHLSILRLFCVIFTQPLVKIPSVSNIFFSAT
jgi:NADH:ubiquinone oxidoreductase subunit C